MIQLLHTEFSRDIKPLFIASGRNNVEVVGEYIGRNIRASLGFEEAVRRIEWTCKNSKTPALKIWIMDFEKIYEERTFEKLSEIVAHYSKRAGFTPAQKRYFEKLG